MSCVFPAPPSSSVVRLIGYRHCFGHFARRHICPFLFSFFFFLVCLMNSHSSLFIWTMSKLQTPGCGAGHFPLPSSTEYQSHGRFHSHEPVS
ncbi:unnamed protein product [Penicillium nalgiovense]|nr:unnamed protein product [Penicillium nalgiovense]